MIKFKNVHKHFKDLHVINGVNLEVKQGEVVVVCGPSGSGKSTLIRTVNQLERIESGEIWVDGINVADPKTDLNKVREEVGFVFQGFNLYPHLTVLENIILSPMKVKNQSREEAEKKAMELLERVGLAHKKDARPRAPSVTRATRCRDRAPPCCSISAASHSTKPCAANGSFAIKSFSQKFRHSRPPDFSTRLSSESTLGASSQK